jgi:hypothetical protein
MTRKAIKIDMEYLVFAYQDTCAENLYYLDTEYGEIRLVNRELSDLKDLTDELELSNSRFLYVPKPPKDLLHQDLQAFAASVADHKLGSLLSIGLESPHALAAFRKILSAHEAELARLEAFLISRTNERVLTWLRANGLEPQPQGDGN